MRQSVTCRKQNVTVKFSPLTKLQHTIDLLIFVIGDLTDTHSWLSYVRLIMV